MKELLNYIFLKMNKKSDNNNIFSKKLFSISLKRVMHLLILL